ncbi:MAG: hypothetical protein H7A32_00905 [Deltaproteobacteria bacterium]|nr:hypothetical protein [Deltaproteobacteria bacterium]
MKKIFPGKLQLLSLVSLFCVLVFAMTVQAKTDSYREIQPIKLKPIQAPKQLDAQWKKSLCSLAKLKCPDEDFYIGLYQAKIKGKVSYWLIVNPDKSGPTLAKFSLKQVSGQDGKLIADWQLEDSWDFSHYQHSQAKTYSDPLKTEIYPALYPVNPKEYAIALINPYQENFAAGGAYYHHADFVLLSKKSSPQAPLVSIPFECSWLKSGCFLNEEEWEKLNNKHPRPLDCYVEYEDRVEVEVLPETINGNYQWAFIGFLKYTKGAPKGSVSNTRSYRLPGVIALNPNVKAPVVWSENFPFCRGTDQFSDNLQIMQKEVEAMR